MEGAQASYGVLFTASCRRHTVKEDDERVYSEHAGKHFRPDPSQFGNDGVLSGAHAETEPFAHCDRHLGSGA